MSPPMRLALCPSCENWQPTLEGGSTQVTRRCIAGIEGAPKVALCHRFLKAPGRGGIQDWVEPAANNDGVGQES